MDKKLLDAALEYRRKFGLPVIPIEYVEEKDGKLKKKPTVSWKVYQEKKPSVEETRTMFSNDRAQGIAVITGKGSGVCSLDLDSYKPNYDPVRVYGAFGDLPDTPTFTTPRGGTQHLFKCPAEGVPSITDLLPGVDVKGDGGLANLPPSSNGLGRYEWVERKSLLDLSLAPLPAGVVELLSKAAIYNNNYLKGGCGGDPVYRGHGVTFGVTDPGRRQVTPDDPTLFVEGRRDNDLFHTALTLARGGSPRHEIEQTLARLASACSPPFDPHEIKAKVDSALKRLDDGERNISAEVWEFIESTHGWFVTPDCAKRLLLTSRDQKKAMIKAFLRFHQKGLLERHPDRDGMYRRREVDCEAIDFMAAADKPLDVRYPLGIEALVNTRPKTVTIVAGSPDAGKTAFMLNFAWMNKDRHAVNYFSSEMGSDEMRARLQLFGYPLSDWKKIDFRERSSNFQDVIRPDEINIVDFLELHKDFYEVGGMIKDIWDRLGKGIAVIGIQKPRGRDEGLGGGRTLEKARLYLAMEGGRIKIVKAKNWVDPMKNPNKLCMDFKIVRGCKLLEQSAWTKEI